MQSAVTLVPPIAIATVLNVGLFAGMWREYQAERRHGTPSWRGPLGGMCYGGAILLFLYLRGFDHPPTQLDLFAFAVLGEAAGVVVVCTILNALVFTRGRPRGERVSAFVQSGVAVCFLIVGLFAGK